MPPHLTPEEIEAVWRNFLTTGDERAPARVLVKRKQLYHFFRRLPAAPRCRMCHAPFKGPGGQLVRLLFDRGPSKLNPLMCNYCDKFAATYHGGAEVPVSVLFADIRGSTTLAEGMRPRDFHLVVNRFYNAATEVLFDAHALVEKFIGDEVTGVFAPGLAGQDHAAVAVQTAKEILAVTGHRDPGGPWVPVGIGVHTGIAYVGAVGGEQGVPDIAALGDAINVGARLAALAGPGQIIFSADTAAAARLPMDGLESRELQLKGRAEPVTAWVLPA